MARWDGAACGAPGGGIEQIWLAVNRIPPPRNRDPVDDDGLISRVAGGDDQALRSLFDLHAPMLAARLRAVLPAAEVEDVLQETFIAAWRAAPRYRPQGAPGAWLWGIARRQAALALRRRGPAPLSLSDVEGLWEQGSPDPAAAAALRADLAAAVGELGPPGTPERDVWRLRYVEDRSVSEIAAMTGLPEGTVKSRAHRARRVLRAVLGRHLAMEGGS